MSATREDILQSAASATGNGTAINTGGRGSEHTVEVQWSTSVSAGAVTVETAPYKAYAGTWTPVHVLTYASGSPKVESVQWSGLEGAIRARISTTVVGGTVTATYRGGAA